MSVPVAMARLLIESRTPRQTRLLGQEIGRQAERGDIYLLIGNLGAGKTWLAYGIAQGLGVTENVISPSFVLVREYRGRLPFFHIDLYRLETPGEVETLGLEGYLYGPGVCAVEWADRALAYFPKESLTIKMEYVSSRSRRLLLEARGPRYEELLACLKGNGWGE